MLDAVPGAGAGRVVSWALLVEPEAPAGDAPFPDATAVIPTSAHSIGRLGAFFTTDLRLFNTRSGEIPARSP